MQNIKNEDDENMIFEIISRLILIYCFLGYMVGIILIIVIHAFGIILPKRWHFEAADSKMY